MFFREIDSGGSGSDLLWVDSAGCWGDSPPSAADTWADAAGALEKAVAERSCAFQRACLACITYCTRASTVLIPFTVSNL